jgi:FdhD protein
VRSMQCTPENVLYINPGLWSRHWVIFLGSGGNFRRWLDDNGKASYQQARRQWAGGRSAKYPIVREGRRNRMKPVTAEDVSLMAEKAVAVAAVICDEHGQGTEQPQYLVKEKPVTLYLNHREIVTLLCTGSHLDELAVGFLKAEGFLESPEDLGDLRVDEEAGKVEVISHLDTSLVDRLWQKRTVTSGCGKGTIFYHALDSLLSAPVESDLRITPSQVWERMQDLHRLSKTYRHTHGVHNTALATPEAIILFRDDIGRHNAVDMIIGHAFLHSLSLNDKLLITTGRLTSEILIKAAKVGLPLLVSRNTATTLAVELAKALNITLIGYVRTGKSTVYSGLERLVCVRA